MHCLSFHIVPTQIFAAFKSHKKKRGMFEKHMLMGGQGALLPLWRVGLHDLSSSLGYRSFVFKNRMRGFVISSNPPSSNNQSLALVKRSYHTNWQVTQNKLRNFERLCEFQGGSNTQLP